MPRLNDLARLERDRALKLDRLAMERILKESFDDDRDSYDFLGYGWDNSPRRRRSAAPRSARSASDGPSAPVFCERTWLHPT